jgi:hypothetical protein
MNKEWSIRLPTICFVSAGRRQSAKPHSVTLIPAADAFVPCIPPRPSWETDGQWGSAMGFRNWDPVITIWQSLVVVLQQRHSNAAWVCSLCSAVSKHNYGLARKVYDNASSGGINDVAFIIARLRLTAQRNARAMIGQVAQAQLWWWLWWPWTTGRLVRLRWTLEPFSVDTKCLYGSARRS